MSVNRRYFLKGMIGTGFIALSAIFLKPTEETVEGRILRLFSKCDKSGSLASFIFLSLFHKNKPLSLRQVNGELLKLSDEKFIKMIDKNIRQDFAEGHIIDMAGWQMARTEITILRLVSLEKKL